MKRVKKILKISKSWTHCDDNALIFKNLSSKMCEHTFFRYFYGIFMSSFVKEN